jgi:isoleucyl-tRNA synthetase
VDYKSTLNLPQTQFSMRAEAAKKEPAIQAFWQEEQIYQRLSESNSGDPFVLHDGPPYANGDIHMGTTLNKILKDIVNKYQILRGRKVRYVPGWDCHGLPIELKVLQSLPAKVREGLTPLELRQKAKEYALGYIDTQRASFKRLGVWGSWDHPYMTLAPDYEAAQIEVFGQMALKGYIYRGLKPVHWSPSSQTALAEAELEYPDNHIWTTTP